MRVIFSTHAVLADALTHGFVSLHRLALIVFDEGANREDRVFIFFKLTIYKPIIV